MTSERSEASDDEWEETILVAEVNGVLDANLVRQAIDQGSVKLRNPSESNPILQIGLLLLHKTCRFQISNSLYTGKWARTVGTDIILEAVDNQVKIVSTTDRYLKTEKALLTARAPDPTKNGQQATPAAAGITTKHQPMRNAKAEK